MSRPSKNLIMLASLLPPYTYRRLAARLAINCLRGRGRLLQRLTTENWQHYRKYGGRLFNCNVCGQRTRAFFDFPDLDLRHEHRIGELRETLQCVQCGATLRQRALATALLRVASAAIGRPVHTIREAANAKFGGLRVLDTDAFSPISEELRKLSDYMVTSFIPDRPFDTEIATNHYNINLERIGFPSDHFDLVITSDVMEHVREIGQAHLEIHRVLKPGGHYVFTVPYDEACATHHHLVDTSGTDDVFLVPPQYHGDPLTGGILAYRVFGRAIHTDLTEIGFEIETLRIDDSAALIIDGDVFVARKSN
jgi:SAM-dependent methyltransferase